MVPTVATGASYGMRQPLVTAGHSVALARFWCNGFPRHAHSVFANGPLSSMLNSRIALTPFREGAGRKTMNSSAE